VTGTLLTAFVGLFSDGVNSLNADSLVVEDADTQILVSYAEREYQDTRYDRVSYL
jgi:hypothetical protein